ncbi:hypothetical protein KCU98_g230, partial [Aureobasidium melanogenum]
MQAANLASCRSDDFLEQECPESLGYGLTTLLNVGHYIVGRQGALVQVRFPENTDLGLSALPHDGREWLTGSPLQKQRVLVGLRGVVDESVRGSLHSGSSQNHFWRPLKVAVECREKRKRPAQGEHLRWSIDAGTLEFHDEDVKKETKVYKEGRSRRQKHKELWIVSNAPILPTYYGVSNELVLLIRLSDSQQAARLCIGQIFCNPVLLVSQLGQLRRLWLAVLLAAPVAVADLTELRLNDQHGARFCQTTVESRGDADVDRPLDSWHLEDDEALATPSLPTTVTLNCFLYSTSPIEDTRVDTARLIYPSPDAAIKERLHPCHPYNNGLVFATAHAPERHRRLDLEHLRTSLLLSRHVNMQTNKSLSSCCWASLQWAHGLSSSSTTSSSTYTAPAPTISPSSAVKPKEKDDREHPA